MNIVLLMILLVVFTVVSHTEYRDHLSQLCKTSEFEELTYYDPTLPEPARWSPRNILIQLGHPTKETCPTTWFRWETHPIDKWKWHDEFKIFTGVALPKLEPPIRLSDGTLATDIRQLEQVRTR